MVASGLYGLRLLRRGYGLDAGTSRFDRALWRAAAGEALPLWLATLFSLLYFKGDVVILKAFAGNAEVGAYSAAYKIFEGLMIVPSVVLAATFPPLARAKGDPRAPAPLGGRAGRAAPGAGHGRRAGRLSHERSRSSRWSTARGSRGLRRRCGSWRSRCRSSS